ncbi:hypothetical protein, partial [Citrobacter freundii]|uniref:hypothetical protein n=1 Tax=Citrobacter freundii TaxID=546 RepID=UPI003C6C4431
NNMLNMRANSWKKLKPVFRRNAQSNRRKNAKRLLLPVKKKAHRVASVSRVLHRVVKKVQSVNLALKNQQQKHRVLLAKNSIPRYLIFQY